VDLEQLGREGVIAGCLPVLQALCCSCHLLEVWRRSQPSSGTGSFTSACKPLRAATTTNVKFVLPVWPECRTWKLTQLCVRPWHGVCVFRFLCECVLAPARAG
ncbi:unnamed protein product, partial [Ectocarpus sp. 12 AP-2014]